MNELQKVFKYGESPVRTVVKGEEVWFVAKDVCSVLGIKNHSDSISKLGADEKMLCGVPDCNGRVQSTAVICETGVQKLMTRSNKPQVLDFAQKLGLKVLHARKEASFINILIKSFSHIKSETQFYIDGYRIDLYFPDYNIAIECDEYGHEDRCKKNELKRQKHIEKKLKCKFIRFNPDSETFNIGDVVNSILMEVMKIERNKKSVQI